LQETCSEKRSPFSNSNLECLETVKLGVNADGGQSEIRNQKQMRSRIASVAEGNLQLPTSGSPPAL
jgi:hypothetical protein